MTRKQAPEPGSPIAKPAKGTKRDEAGAIQREEEKAIEAEGKLRKTKQDAEIKDDRTQAQKFEAAAREHGTDQDEDAFKGVLRKLARPKG